MPATVIPSLTGNPVKYDKSWIPAFAGMTEKKHISIIQGKFICSKNYFYPYHGIK